MQYRSFLSTGKQASVLVLGTSGFGTVYSEELSFELMDAYRALGGNFFDTARRYGIYPDGRFGVSEATIGKYIASRGCRDELVLGTKGAHPVDAARTPRLAPADIRSDMQETLDALGCAPDLYWLHRDDVNRPVGEIIETLNGFIEAGYTRALGASNWSPARMREANAYAAAHSLKGFEANQPQWSLARPNFVSDPTTTRMDAEMHAMHCETGMACIPFTSQARGFFSKLFTLGAEELAEGVRSRYMSEGNMRIYDAMLSIRQRTGLSVGAIALAYLTSQPFPTYPIVGASNLDQIEALREAGEAHLSAEDIHLLDAAYEA